MAKKVLLGMSGGVDSSVAAVLLKEQGYEVTGVTLKLKKDRYMTRREGGCCSIDDIEDARRVAQKLGIAHYVFDMTGLFEREVVRYFANEYLHARTPNPCIACNRHIKFGAMLQKAREMGMDFIATGHYAKVEYDPSRERYLLKKAPVAKDQSYVLYSLTQEQLSHTLLPLNHLPKEDIRRLAKEYDLPVAHKADSQEICFIDDNNYARFLADYVKELPPPGKFVDQNGVVLGEHRGIIHYTIGQRKGLGVTFGKPMYVINISPEDNTVTLGEEGSQMKAELWAEDVNWIAFPAPRSPFSAWAKVRYQAAPAPCTVEPLLGGGIHIRFETPQRSITPGQAVVLYEGDLVLGGGTILR